MDTEEAVLLARNITLNSDAAPNLIANTVVKQSKGLNGDLKPEYKKTTKDMMGRITKTYVYNFDPLKPHFYMVKLGFTGVCISFLISAQKR